MALNFPVKPDVQLENSPLVEVVCQVRFPPILRIASEEPSEFQEKIRDQFPHLELEHGLLIRAPGIGGKSVPIAEAQSKIYRFRTSDDQTAVSLAPDFFALSTTHYTTWENFSQLLTLLSETMRAVYRPTYAARVGLRYINRFTPDNTGCKTVREMFALFRPELTASALSEAWGHATELRSRMVLEDGKAKLAIGTIYGLEESPFFLLDFDYYEEGQLGLDDLLVRCAGYNDVLYRAFRWCLLDEKIEAFRPKAKEPRK